MTATASATTWRRAVDQAHAGDARHLLELLLSPTQTDGRGVPLPGAFTALPDDGELRLAIVRVLIFGPLSAATSVKELMTKTGWGKRKPGLADFEVGLAEALLKLDKSMTADDLAGGLDVTGEQLRKRIAKRRRR